MKILAINGSYRDGGFSSAFLEAAALCCKDAGVEYEQINLAKEINLSFCLNCRSCMQHPGSDLGECVIKDGMGDLIKKLESADRYILISPTNFFTVTAIFKRFVERLAIYGYWPWGASAPKYRKKHVNKTALCVTSAAMPYAIGAFFVSSLSILRATAKTLGAKHSTVYFQARNETTQYALTHKELEKTRKALQGLVK